MRRSSQLALLPSFALIVSLALLTGGAASAAKVAGVNLVERTTIEDTSLSLQGAGLRKKFFIQLYVASLYLDESLDASSADAIVQADAPMFIQLDILSNLLTRDKLIEALSEGFRKSTNDNIAPIESEIEAMNNALVQTLSPGDKFRIFYHPDIGTVVERSGEPLITIPGLAFKQAAFGIWLSQDPVQQSLKQDLLGG